MEHDGILMKARRWTITAFSATCACQTDQVTNTELPRLEKLAPRLQTQQRFPRRKALGVNSATSSQLMSAFFGQD